MYSINIFSNSFLLDIAHTYINTENLSWVTLIKMVYIVKLMIMI